MQTYTHVIITAALGRLIKNREKMQDQPAVQGQREGIRIGQTRLPQLQSVPLIVGSLAPDLALILIAVVFFASDLLAGRTLAPGGDSTALQSNVGWLFRHGFFHEPWIKAAHNLFHAPILTVSYMLFGYWVWRKGKNWGAMLFWFGAGCTLHTLIDIPLHYDDGPLIFFPFDWQTRFASPISYWDPARFGRQFTLVEHLLALVLLIYLAVSWWRRRRAPQDVIG